MSVPCPTKVPLLGDIPLLGLAFRHKITANEKTELLIFMTPYIVNRPTELAAQTEREKNNAEMSHTAFSEEEIDRFLDKVPTSKAKVATPPKKPK